MRLEYLLFPVLLSGCGLFATETVMQVRTGRHVSVRANASLPSAILDVQALAGGPGIRAVAQAPRLRPSGRVNVELDVDGPALTGARRSHAGSRAGSRAAVQTASAGAETRGHGQAEIEAPGVDAMLPVPGRSDTEHGLSTGVQAGVQADGQIAGRLPEQLSSAPEVAISIGLGGAGRVPAETGVLGVAGIDARGLAHARLTPHLSALLGRGVSVEGELLHLQDIGPLSVRPAQPAQNGGLDTAAGASLSLDSPGLRLTAEVQRRAASDESDLIVRLHGGGDSTPAHTPMSVHLVLDRSSSMDSHWGQVLAAAELLIAELSPNDLIHIVAYGARAVEVVAPTEVGDGHLARRALRSIDVGGGTHIEAGLAMGYDAAQRSAPSMRRVLILVSDGVPTVGGSDEASLGALAAQARQSEGTVTSVVGLGHQFDVNLLRRIAAEGSGGFHVARNLDDLAPTLRAELASLARAAATNIELSLELPEGLELVSTLDSGDGVQTTERTLRLGLPQLAAGAERRFVARVRNTDARGAKSIQVSLQHRVAGASPHLREAAIVVNARRRARTEDTSPEARYVGIEAHLGETLQRVGQAVALGEGQLAASDLQAHVAFVGELETTPTPLHHRTRAVAHLAQSLVGMLEGSDHRERRELSQALSALAFQFAR